MDKIFDTTLKNRSMLKGFLDQYTLEQLAFVPEGFNNNIWWNIAHTVATQQALVYRLSGLPMVAPAEFVKKYGKGSFPDQAPTAADVEALKGMLHSLVEKTIEDYNNGIFKEYNEYTTSANVTLASVEDALAFNTFHEGIHLGSILALRKGLPK